MTYISSQHFLNLYIVDEKTEELKNVDKVFIPCVYVGEIDGEEYAIQIDKHHTLAAARRLSIDVEYIVEDDAEGLAGEALLEAKYMDGDYYNVETSDPEENNFNLIW